MSVAYCLVLGGTNDHIELIKQLKTNGFHVVLVDYFANPPAAAWADIHEQVSTRDTEALDQLISKYQPNSIYSACVDSTLVTLWNCSKKYGYNTLFNDAQFHIISNKPFMKSWMQRHGFPSSRYELIDDFALLEQMPFSLPLVVKPSMGNSSKGVSLIHEASDWKTALELANSMNREAPILVEEFIDGKELSIDLIFLEGRVHLVMISEIIKKSKYSATITQNVYNRETEEQYRDAVLALASQLGEAMGLENTLMLMQCMVNDEGLSIIEFSLRIGGGSKHHLVQTVKNINLIDVYIQLMQNRTDAVYAQLNEMKTLYHHALMEYIYPNHPGYIQTISVAEYAPNEGRVFLYKNAGDQLNSIENSSNRLAGILVCGNHWNNMLAAKEALLQKLCFSIQQTN
ncbi:MAG: ATP-grasp domain-containing protein [Chitinophagaceae bacterium]